MGNDVGKTWPTKKPLDPLKNHLTLAPACGSGDEDKSGEQASWAAEMTKWTFVRTDRYYNMQVEISWKVGSSSCPFNYCCLIVVVRCVVSCHEKTCLWVGQAEASRTANQLREQQWPDSVACFRRSPESGIDHVYVWKSIKICLKWKVFRFIQEHERRHVSLSYNI